MSFFLDSATQMISSYRQSHRPVQVSDARDDNSTTSYYLLVAAPIAPSLLSWQPGSSYSASPRQQQPQNHQPYAPGGLTSPFNLQETDLIQAGYTPCFKPSELETTNNSNNNKRKKMAEPRARVARHKGQMNFSSERMYFFHSTVSF